MRLILAKRPGPGPDEVCLQWDPVQDGGGRSTKCYPTSIPGFPSRLLGGGREDPEGSLKPLWLNSALKDLPTASPLLLGLSVFPPVPPPEAEGRDKARAPRDSASLSPPWRIASSVAPKASGRRKPGSWDHDTAQRLARLGCLPDRGCAYLASGLTRSKRTGSRGSALRRSAGHRSSLDSRTRQRAPDGMKHSGVHRRTTSLWLPHPPHRGEAACHRIRAGCPFFFCPPTSRRLPLDDRASRACEASVLMPQCPRSLLRDALLGTDSLLWAFMQRPATEAAPTGRETTVPRTMPEPRIGRLRTPR